MSKKAIEIEKRDKNKKNKKIKEQEKFSQKKIIKKNKNIKNKENVKNKEKEKISFTQQFPCFATFLCYGTFLCCRTVFISRNIFWNRATCLCYGTFLYYATFSCQATFLKLRIIFQITQHLVFVKQHVLCLATIVVQHFMSHNMFHVAQHVLHYGTFSMLPGICHVMKHFLRCASFFTSSNFWHIVRHFLCHAAFFWVAQDLTCLTTCFTCRVIFLMWRNILRVVVYFSCHTNVAQIFYVVWRFECRVTFFMSRERVMSRIICLVELIFFIVHNMFSVMCIFIFVSFFFVAHHVLCSAVFSRSATFF